MALVLAAAIVIAVSGADRAIASDTALAEMDHASWTARDGAPQGIKSLALAADGLLWIGTESGLFNFDGRTFSSFQPQAGEPDLPPGQVRSILATRDGAIWVGFRYGGVARIQRGRVKLFTQADRLQLTRIDHIQQSSDGALWAIQHQQNLIRLGADGNWHLQPSPLGDLGGAIHDIFINSSDTLWLAQGGRLYRRPLNQSKYFVTRAKADWMFGISETPDHSLWVNNSITNAPEHPMGRTQHVDQHGNVLDQLPDTDNLADLLYARDGSLITIPYDNGISRIPAQALAEPALLKKDGVEEEYHQKDGLSSESIAAMLLDADGNLWTGGKKGLDRFRKARLVPYTLKYGVSDVYMCAGKAGDVWIVSGGTRDQFYEVSGGVTKSFPDKGQIYSIFCGQDGDTWLLSNNGIFNVHADKFASVPSIPGTHAFDIQQIVASADHTLFASVVGGPDKVGIWRYAHNNWIKLTGVGIPFSAPTTEYMDSRGRLWTGYNQGQIGLPLEGHGRLLSSGNPGLGAIFVILETTHGLFAGGMNGIAVLRDNRAEMLNFSELSTFSRRRRIGGVRQWRSVAEHITRHRSYPHQRAARGIGEPSIQNEI